MRCLIFAVAFSSVLGSSLAVYLLDREDASLDSLSANTFTEGMDVFPDTALPDPQDTTLSFNEESTLGEPSSFSDSDPLLIPACNDGNDLMSLSEIRRREEGVCDTKDPALDGLKVPGFSDIFKKLLPNIWQQQDDQDVIPRENGNIKKCKEPWIWNLCCNVCLSIPTSNPELGFFYDEFGACYVNVGTAPCDTEYEVCCQRDDPFAQKGFKCYIIEDSFWKL